MFLGAAGVATASYPGGYYNAMDGKKQADLKSAAKGCVSQHTRLVYTQLPVYWQYTEGKPDTVEGYKRGGEMYADEV